MQDEESISGLHYWVVSNTNEKKTDPVEERKKEVGGAGMGGGVPLSIAGLE